MAGKAILPEIKTNTSASKYQSLSVNLNEPGKQKFNPQTKFKHLYILPHGNKMFHERLIKSEES